MTDRERFEKIRGRVIAVCERRERQRECYLKRYGRNDPPRSWKTGGELTRDEAIGDALAREAAKLFAMLDRIGCRDWRTGVPSWWVCVELTFEDAVTDGQLSVVPPVAFGRTSRDMERFAAPVQSRP